MIDDRGRVPFALVGVVLLVTATAVGATLATRDAVAPSNATERAADRATVAAETVLERAAIRASVAAAANPVLDPANTTYGRVLRTESAFRDALALRVYAATARAFDAQRVRTGGASATLSLPGIDSAADARRALRRVDLTRLAPNRVRISVRNATLTVRRDGRVVGTRRWSPSVVVATPVLALHDRTDSFDARLDRGVLSGYGLARETTVRLAPYTAARGLAQYGGAPIENVLANRHVAVAANDGLLAVQRATFGRTARGAPRAVERAYALTGVSDALAVTRLGLRARANAILGQNDLPSAPHPFRDRDPPEATLTPAAAADAALVAYLDGTAAPALTGTLAAAYRFDARRVARVTRVAHSVDEGTPPRGWVRVDATTRTETTVTTRPAVRVEPPTGYRAVDTATRRVARIRTTEQMWTNGSAVRRTTSVERTVDRVTVVLAAAPRPLSAAPDRPVRRLPDRAIAAVRAALLPDGGVDALAAAAANGESVAASRTVSIPPPEAVRARVLRELDALRDALANVSTTTRVDGSALLASNPVAALERALARERHRLVAPPARFESIADRAVTAVRARYVALTADRVAERAAESRDVQDALRGAFADLGGWLPTGFTTRPVPETVVRDVTASPRYLSLAPRDGGAALAARNVNLLTLPYGDAADAIVSTAFGAGERAVRLATAADLLAAAPGDVPRLDAAVRDATARAAARFVDVLVARAGVDRERAAAVVAAARARWRTPAARARATTNGSLAAAVVAAARDRGVVTGGNRLVVAAALRSATRDVRASGDAGVPEDVVRTARRTVSAELTAALGNASSRTARRVLGKRLGALPAGFPVAPIPGFWYATMNAWTVSVRGGYDRFAVTGGAVPPGYGRGVYEYVRRDAAVRVDVDGDGRQDLLGRNERVDFAFDTVVVAAVPPGPRGVGDVDGNADERSPGW